MKLRTMVMTAMLIIAAGGIAFADATEDLISKYYRDILDRDPDPAAQIWKEEIGRMVGLNTDVKEGFIALAKVFFTSAEYILQDKNHFDYVTDLYQTFLNRTPQQSEIDAWVEYLQQGLSRNVVFNSFAFSEEFKLYMENIFGEDVSLPECNLVNDLYRGLQGRLPDSIGLNGWAELMRNVISVGEQAVRELAHQIAREFLQSLEYILQDKTNRQFLEDLYNGILRRGATKEEFDAWIANIEGGLTREQLLQEFTNSVEFQLRVQEITDHYRWETSSLQEQGLDFLMINMLSYSIGQGDFGNVHSFLIVRNGYLVFEEYYGGHNADTLHPVHGITKSVTSALIGIAMDRGFMEGIVQGVLNHTVLDLFPEYQAVINADSAKQNLLFQHILTMSSGLEWNQTDYSFDDPQNDWHQAYYSGDSIQYVLQKPLIADPGTKFNYNGGLTMMLSGLIHKNTGLHTDGFAKEYLFKPLGIYNYAWDHTSNGATDADGGLSLRPRDMAKIGYLYVNNGGWKDRRILSESWINESSKAWIEVEDAYLLGLQAHYGFQWWLLPLEGVSGITPGNNDIYMAVGGSFEQFIFAIPSLNMVVVITAEVAGTEENILKIYSILPDHILPAVETN